MVHAYTQKIFAGQKPVYDGRKNLYSKDPLPIGRDKVHLLVHAIALFVIPPSFSPVRFFLSFSHSACRHAGCAGREYYLGLFGMISARVSTVIGLLLL